MEPSSSLPSRVGLGWVGEFTFLTGFPGDTDTANLGLHFENRWFNGYSFQFPHPDPQRCLASQSEASLIQFLQRINLQVPGLGMETWGERNGCQAIQGWRRELGAPALLFMCFVRLPVSSPLPCTWCVVVPDAPSAECLGQRGSLLYDSFPGTWVGAFPTLPNQLTLLHLGLSNSPKFAEVFVLMLFPLLFSFYSI